ncbi:MAG TPA: hypothetical protein VHW66_05085 [Stellaceae bacterium]|jgi:hypothetical protein|nr:hypothetical protein [Stellaceae bacterium]
MSLKTNKWFRRIGFAAIAATVLGAATIPTAPAQARTWVSIGGIHFGIGGHRHHGYWRNGGWYHNNYGGWRRVY